MQTSKFALSLLAAIFLFHAGNSAGDIGNQENPKSSISSKGLIKPDSSFIWVMPSTIYTRSGRVQSALQF
jgi:hypothetical protein